jgi:eukaryotic-like serine/threonine-protein kinase
MATVYEAAHTVLPRRAALKVLHGPLLRHPGMATRMVQEAAILEGVRHPGVVRVYECNLLPDRRPWIAMELVEGETLANRLHYAVTLPALEVALLLGDIADVLAAVHKADVIHRDLKPDNILCTPTNGDYALRVLDWGVARLGPMGRLTLDGLTPGTPIYMSPEQATGLNVGPACDVYSLGVIAYEALTGAPPFDGRTLAEVVYMHLTRTPLPLRQRCNAPAELCDLVGKMLEKDPALRPGVIEVRQVCRAIAMAMAPYETFELSEMDAESRVGATRCRTAAGELEFGVTEMLPVAPKARWTPEFDHVPAVLVAQRNRVIGPRAPRDQVAGEIISLDKPR